MCVARKINVICFYFIFLGEKKKCILLINNYNNCTQNGFCRNNAGVMFCPYQLSEDGIELQFATNHIGKSYIYKKVKETWFQKLNLKILKFLILELYCIGHFLLTNLLLDTMKNTAKTSGVEGRILNVSSVAHIYTYQEGIQFDSINDICR